jgi:hypothetical protein
VARLRVAPDMQYAAIKATLEAYLGASESDYGTGVLELTYDSALALADDYCNNPFVEDREAPIPVDVPTPSEVKVGVFACTQSMLDASSDGSANVASVKTADLSVSYRLPTNALQESCYAHLYNWRLIPGL